MIDRHVIVNARTGETQIIEVEIPDRDEALPARAWEALEDTRLAALEARIAKVASAAGGNTNAAEVAKVILEMLKGERKRRTTAQAMKLGWQWSWASGQWYPPGEDPPAAPSSFATIAAASAVAPVVAEQKTTGKPPGR